ncbi:Gfo/Idh/MocA family protein [Rossellomorea marisflavi]|uniref:Gfo/Idh/MocA family protein n=1 Tax=Rossellomorea marisflavi TaxID=189381 RepID=UPI00207A0166|nr:Gfo/Idh/MocA family oxidoreductase [Rossellomorea marisflavi]USK92772.1 Gfo/Idh/MocA family oxidoreductase [Rossellomorea marisflavi]
MKDNITIGLIGLGAIAVSSHLVHLKEHPEATIAAVVDMDVERAKAIAERHGIPRFYGDMDAMIADGGIDAVMICTPNSSHIPLARKAAEKGIHVFVEKPIGTELAEVEGYLALAKENGALTMVGMTHRFRKDVKILKGMVEEQGLGDIHYMKAKLFRQRGTPKGWFTDLKHSGGGAMMDIGVHVLDLAWWIAGCPDVKSIAGKTLNVHGNYETKHVSSWQSANHRLNEQGVFNVEDFGAAWVQFKNGCTLSLEIAWAVDGEQDEGISLELYGTKGGASLSPLALFMERDGVLSKTLPVFKGEDPFKDEVGHFIQCVRTGEDPLIDGEAGMHILKMLKGIYESSRRGREIYFD